MRTAVTKRIDSSYWHAVLAMCMVCSLAQIGCAQAASPPVTKAQALKDVKVSSVPGWQEALSETGRFRILFPGQPQGSGMDSAPLKGYRLREQTKNWYAYYQDLDAVASNYEKDLPQTYRDSLETVTRNMGSRLLKQEDVFLHGRLGTEVVIFGGGSLVYIRMFIFGRRMYMLTAERKGAATADAAVPGEVKQFFDSFTYWH